ncbi:MAG: PspC domain-containing protein [Ruminococcus sp.]|nr:PspC domain-containing protein [Ruminococcus sp.]
MNGQKRLYKNSDNKMICGVCAGLAEYFNIDVSIVRILVVLLAFGCGSGLLAYIVAAIILPEKKEVFSGSLGQNNYADGSYNSYDNPGSSDNR